MLPFITLLADILLLKLQYFCYITYVSLLTLRFLWKALLDAKIVELFRIITFIPDNVNGLFQMITMQKHW